MIYFLIKTETQYFVLINYEAKNEFSPEEINDKSIELQETKEERWLELSMKLEGE